MEVTKYSTYSTDTRSSSERAIKLFSPTQAPNKKFLPDEDELLYGTSRRIL
jgi:hypothetical protein